MNLAHDAVPVLRSAGLAISVMSSPLQLRCHREGRRRFPRLRSRLTGCSPFTSTTSAGSGSVALRRALGFFAQPKKAAESSGIGTALVVLRFKHKPRNPLLPLARPSVCRLCTDVRHIVPGPAAERLAESDGGGNFTAALHPARGQRASNSGSGVIRAPFPHNAPRAACLSGVLFE